jgi:L-ascorbate metabolism protein UlaG (beta-lactamase superfamily)
MRSGKELLKEIDTCRVNFGELAIWWLGQHSFIVKAGGTIIYLDPFLSPKPCCALFNTGDNNPCGLYNRQS